MKNNHIEAATESSDVLQSEAGSRTDELLASITNVYRQALESRVHLTFENNDRLLQIYNELRQLLPANEEMQLPPNINMQT
jgi:thiamine pyrophosphokinase